ncbi:MAG: T9SS type A sorting domain-containing protein, partial [Bacteroidota bacterium]|nr:T9SS type A sorting domain-containing protein [Bacteroidota bacterium]
IDIGAYENNGSNPPIAPPLSIDKNDNNDIIVSCYPNPVNNVLNLSFSSNLNRLNKIEIYNIEGKKIKTFTSEKQNVSFDVSSFDYGLYQIIISNEQSIKTLNFLKL